MPFTQTVRQARYHAFRQRGLSARDAVAAACDGTRDIEDGDDAEFFSSSEDDMDTHEDNEDSNDENDSNNDEGESEDEAIGEDGDESNDNEEDVPLTILQRIRDGIVSKSTYKGYVGDNLQFIRWCEEKRRIG